MKCRKPISINSLCASDSARKTIINILWFDLTKCRYTNYNSLIEIHEKVDIFCARERLGL